MQCEKCSKEIIEGNFVQVPVHQVTPRGVIATVIHVICCDTCCQSITQKISGSAKVLDAEIVETKKEKL
jgi:hypothetical protein